MDKLPLTLTFSEMKRAKPTPPEYDPVYPYDATLPPIMPPFVTPDGGLKPNPDGGLSIKTQPPITVNSDGSVALKYDKKTITINSKNELQATAAVVNLRMPLFKQPISEIIEIGYGKGLHLNTQFFLEPKIEPPLGFKANSIGLNIDPNTLIVENETLKVVPVGNISTEAPLAIDKQKKLITLLIGKGLERALALPEPTAPNLGELQIKKRDPFIFNADGSLGLNYDINKLDIVDHKLTTKEINIQTQPPIFFSNNSLSLNIGAGLATNSNSLTIPALESNGLEYNTNKLKVKVNPSHGLHIANGGICVKYGSGLECNNAGILQLKKGWGLKYGNQQHLQIARNPDTPASGFNLVDAGLSIALGTNSGLNLTNQGLIINLRSNSGLSANGGALGANININEGLYIKNGAISINAGKGLQFEPHNPPDNGKHQLNLKLFNNSGLLIDSNGLKINTGNFGLHVENNQLAINTTYPLAFEDNSHKLILKYNKGLKLEENGLRVHIGNEHGLEFLSTTGELRVKADTNNGIGLTANGVKVNVDTLGPLGFNGGNLTFKYDKKNALDRSDGELQVILANLSGLEMASTNNEANRGLAIKCGQGLQLTPSPQQYITTFGTPQTGKGKITLKLIENDSALELNDSGVGVKIKNLSGLQSINNEGLSIKLPNNGGLTSDNDGLKIKFASNSGLEIDQGLKVKLGRGMHIHTGNTISVNAVAPLGWSGNNSEQITIRLGNGLGVFKERLGIKLGENSGLSLTEQGLSISRNVFSNRPPSTILSITEHELNIKIISGDIIHGVISGIISQSFYQLVFINGQLVPEQCTNFNIENDETNYSEILSGKPFKIWKQVLYGENAKGNLFINFKKNDPNRCVMEFHFLPRVDKPTEISMTDFSYLL